MSDSNFPKSIDISTQEGLDLLKLKAKHYGHYAENLKIFELIEEIESLRWDPNEAILRARKKLEW